MANFQPSDLVLQEMVWLMESKDLLVSECPLCHQCAEIPNLCKAIKVRKEGERFAVSPSLVLVSVSVLY